MEKKRKRREKKLADSIPPLSLTTLSHERLCCFNRFQARHKSTENFSPHKAEGTTAEGINGCKMRYAPFPPPQDPESRSLGTAKLKY